MFFLNDAEVERVRKAHHISTLEQWEERTGVSRRTWHTALKDLRPTTAVLEALAGLGADPAKILVSSAPQRAAA